MVALIVCVIGLVLYLISRNNAEVREVGRISFAFGLLVFLLQFGERGLALFR